MGGVTYENGDFGVRAVLTAAWSPSLVLEFDARDVAELELNHAKGWRGADMAFLSALPRLRAFKIIDPRIESVQPVHLLSELRSLEVITSCKTPLDFNSFPHLVDCALEWRPKSSSVFDCVTLQKLFINRLSEKHSEAFSRLVNLESLAILNSSLQDLRGLGALKRLRSLRLANLNRLTSLAGVEGLTNLEELDINRCRGVTDIDEVGSLLRLRKLHLNNGGNVQSLRPLDKLGALESVLFYETTNIVDGDLSPLFRQKHLAQVSFQNRDHYSHRREDFGTAHSR